MSKKYLFIVIFIYVILTISLFNIGVIKALCPICERGLSSRSIKKIGLAITLKKIKSRFLFLWGIYKRLLMFGYDLPSNLSNSLLLSKEMIIELEDSLSSGNLGEINLTIMALQHMISIANESMYGYISRAYPNPYLGRFYRSQYFRLLNKISFVYSLSRYIGMDEGIIDEIESLSNLVKRRINNLYGYSVLDHEEVIFAASEYVNRVWLLLNLDKIYGDYFNGISYYRISSIRDNDYYLINVLSRVWGRNSDPDFVHAILNNSIYLFNAGDKLFFVYGKVAEAGYVYSLADGYMRYYLDVSKVFNKNIEYLHVSADMERPIIYLGEAGNVPILSMFPHAVIIFVDVNSNGYIDNDEIVGKIILDNASWVVSRDNNKFTYRFNSYLVNITVEVSRKPSFELRSPIFLPIETPVVGDFSRVVRIKYVLNNKVFKGVGSALSLYVISYDSGMNYRWDHFMTIDSFNIDYYPGESALSLYFPDYLTKFSRSNMYLFNKSCCPSVYELGISSYNLSTTGNIVFWVRAGPVRGWWDRFLHSIPNFLPLYLLFTLVAIAVILLYLVRYAYLIDIF